MTILPSNNLPNSEPYCYNELELLNLAILMCLESNASGVDNILFKHKYKIISIDRSVDTAVGTIKYDVCLTSIEKEITLGIEIKGENASNLVYCKIKVQTSAKNLYRVLHYFCA